MKISVKLISISLCFIMFCSLIVGILQKVVVRADDFDYANTPYETLTYQQLEDNTTRDIAPSDGVYPQFTVFTYGCGGSLEHWSNNSNYYFVK